MGFLDQMAKAAALGMAVEMSKNKKGKPDPYKAAGIAAGMGYTALSDRASLGAMLGSEGAFDDVPPDDGYEDELAYGEAEDGMEDFTDDGFDDSIWDNEDDEDWDEDEDWEDDEDEEEDFDEDDPGSDEENDQSAAEEAVRREREREKRLAEWEAERQQRLEERRQELEVAKKDKKIYHYCSVVFGDDFHPYHYRTEDTSLKIGDKVLVPAGKENEECIATVVSVEEHTRLTVPFPLNKTKFIIAKYTEEEK